jgi:hypothetical protein
MSMEEVLKQLTIYTFALRDALECTNESKERPQITRHLAATAEMYALLYMHKTTDAIDHIVKKESRGHGLSYLSGEGGKKVAAEWVKFTEALGSK